MVRKELVSRIAMAASVLLFLGVCVICVLFQSKYTSTASSEICGNDSSVGILAVEPAGQSAGKLDGQPGGQIDGKLDGQPNSQPNGQLVGENSNLSQKPPQKTDEMSKNNENKVNSAKNQLESSNSEKKEGGNPSNIDKTPTSEKNADVVETDTNQNNPSNPASKPASDPTEGEEMKWVE